MTDIDEIGSIEHIRAHIKKLNNQAKQRDDCGFFDDLCDELDTQSRQHIRDVATIVDDWYTEWDDLSADTRQEPDDDIDPFVIG